MNEVYVGGVGMTPLGKDFRPIGVILADACQKALLGSTPFTYDLNPDCLIIGCMDPIRFARQAGLDSLVGMEMGLPRDIEIYHVERGSATGAAAVELRKQLASSGQKVLVCFGEKMKGKLKNEDIPTQISTVIAEEERERGLGEMPAVAALASINYMNAYKISAKEFRNICFEMSSRSLGYGALTHHLGASGGVQLVELVWQLRGQNQYKDMFGEELSDLNYGLWFNMSGFVNTCIVGILERAEPTREHEGIEEKFLPQYIPEELVPKEPPRKDTVLVTTEYVSPDEEKVNVAIIQTSEGDFFRIGLAKGPFFQAVLHIVNIKNREVLHE